MKQPKTDPVAAVQFARTVLDQDTRLDEQRRKIAELEKEVIHLRYVHGVASRQLARLQRVTEAAEFFTPQDEQWAMEVGARVEFNRRLSRPVQIVVRDMHGRVLVRGPDLKKAMRQARAKKRLEWDTGGAGAGQGTDPRPEGQGAQQEGEGGNPTE